MTNYKGVKDARKKIRAIDHKLRQSIIELLIKKGQLSVTEIYVKLRLEQSVASQHLAILRGSNFVITRRDGKSILYSVNQPELDRVSCLCEQINAK